jgi:3-oxoacyl-[acyl-carrier-protein] synthase III
VTNPVYIAGSGTYLPGEPIPFDDIDDILGELLNAPPKIKRWIKRTKPVIAELLDIKYLHYAIDPMTREFTEDNVSMAVKAARSAIDAAGISNEDIDLICYGSAHQDQMPTASVRIQEALGIESCDELSIHANCTSAYKALYLAHELIKNGKNRCALVVSASMSSSELRAEYYNQPIVDKESLFLRWFLCDGSGALLLTSDKSLSKGFGVEQTYIESIGGKRRSHMFNERPALWLNPKIEFEKGLHHLKQSFGNSLAEGVFQEGENSVFFAGFKRMLAEGSCKLEDIKLFQINLPAKHIADSVKDEFRTLGMPASCFYSKLDEIGYSGPPMALICLDKIIREEHLKTGDKVASFVTEVSKFMQAGYVVQVHG